MNNKMVTMNLTEWINEQLRERGWSMRELARRADVSHATISNVMNGQTQPGTSLCVKLAVALDVSTDYVLRLGGFLPPATTDAEDEAQILSYWREAPPESRPTVLAMLGGLKMVKRATEPVMDQARYEDDPELFLLFSLWQRMPTWRRRQLIQELLDIPRADLANGSTPNSSTEPGHRHDPKSKQ